jgi:hypothetical protein
MSKKTQKTCKIEDIKGLEIEKKQIRNRLSKCRSRKSRLNDIIEEKTVAINIVLLAIGLYIYYYITTNFTINSIIIGSVLLLGLFIFFIRNNSNL